MRVYFENTLNLDPNDILAPLNGTATSGVSVSTRTGANLATQPTTWHYDFTDGLISIGGGTQDALGIGDPLTWFEQDDQLVWIDTDQSGTWTSGDALFIGQPSSVTARISTYTSPTR